MLDAQLPPNTDLVIRTTWLSLAALRLWNQVMSFDVAPGPRRANARRRDSREAMPTWGATSAPYVA